MKLPCLVILTLCCSTLAYAHRLNEYLQAATISLSRNMVRFDFRLTAGIAAAPIILEQIDLDKNGQISQLEEHHYLALFARDISVTLDNGKANIRLISASFPAVTAFKQGIGDVIISYEVPFDTLIDIHRLKLNNRHYPTLGIYLVNTLIPADTTIRVTGQDRNLTQSVYQLDFETGMALNTAQTFQADHWPVVRTYVMQGLWHILIGYDHLLFLCALSLGAAGLWDLIRILTLFTIAHSVTLTMAVFGVFDLSEQIIEPLIAVSIIFVAVQNMVWPDKAGSHYRLSVAFVFGLLHGLGFAGELLTIMHEMTFSIVVCAILGFSIGVELGNQLVILPLLGSLQILKKVTKAEWPQKIKMFASAVVAIGGIFYLIMGIKLGLSK